MSFASETKDEAARVEIPTACCPMAELTAMLGACGTLHLTGGGKVDVSLSTEHAPTARRLVKLIQACFGLRPTLSTTHTKRLGGRSTYTLTLLGEEAMQVLSHTGILSGDGQGKRFSRKVPARFFRKACCRRAFLRGAFLAAGSITNPEKEYHLEFVLADEAYGASLIEALEKSGLRPKTMRRKGMVVVYLKEVESIVSLLAQIGAHTALLTLESVRVEKDVRNSVNRAVNCDSANLSKTVNASEQQVQAINLLKLRQVLPTLPDSLQEMAQVRLSHPEATLAELGELTDPPLGKSGVNHRLRRLVALAETIQKQEEEKA